MNPNHSTSKTHKSACILCSLNCGIEITLDEQGHFHKILGDPDHPISQGYMCQKATRLNFYQHAPRLQSPLRKKSDGSFEEISWDTAIQEIAEKLLQIKNTHGGETIAYAGGGGQGNHFPGMYAAASRVALGTPYVYSALAQEKTGNFWVHGKLFGKQNANYDEPVDTADYVIIIGANPLQSHGIPQARNVINQLARDKNRTLVVIDPRVSDTAKKADIHLQVKPGRDAFLMAAMLGIIVQEGLEDKDFLTKHTIGFEALKPHFMQIPTEKYAEIAHVPFHLVQKVARDMAAADSVCIRSDLGIEMSYHSTLNAYLKRLLFLITGNFGRKNTNHLTTWFFPLIGNSKEPEEGGIVTQVTKAKEICKLFPPNVLPLEIDSEHPKRTRALIVESANPLSSYADAPRQRAAYQKLDLMVVIDIAMTETAQMADYVLPAASQFEKMEATFFTDNFLQLRRPVLPPMEGTLPEAEIHTRLLRALGAIPASFPELEEAALADRKDPSQGIFYQALLKTFAQNPHWQAYGIVILRETLGKALPEGFQDAAFLWFSSHLYAQKYPKAVNQAGIQGKPPALGEIIFQKILNSPSGVILSKPDIEDHWNLIAHPDKKVHLYIPELTHWLDELPESLSKIELREKNLPFNLIAGERRSYNANTVIRNPEWRKNDQEGYLKINPQDAELLGIQNEDAVKVFNEKGMVQVLAKLSDEIKPGVLSMPNAYGLSYEGEKDFRKIGAALNELTASEDCDPIAKTPYHKNVRVNIEKILAPK
ncbi:MAG: molybdopterin-dependent oxidoreductase [Microscillaceae bacterium]|nr:molybdopterin-dependent oxidoreductase [Microscillaceae bacterium]